LLSASSRFLIPKNIICQKYRQSVRHPHITCHIITFSPILGPASLNIPFTSQKRL